MYADVRPADEYSKPIIHRLSKIRKYNGEDKLEYENSLQHHARRKEKGIVRA